MLLTKNVYTEPDLLEYGADVHAGGVSSTYCSVWTSANTMQLGHATVGERGMIGVGSVLMPGKNEAMLLCTQIRVSQVTTQRQK